VCARSLFSRSHEGGFAGSCGGAGGFRAQRRRGALFPVPLARQSFFWRDLQAVQICLSAGRRPIKARAFLRKRLCGLCPRRASKGEPVSPFGDPSGLRRGLERRSALHGIFRSLPATALSAGNGAKVKLSCASAFARAGNRLYSDNARLATRRGLFHQKLPCGEWVGRVQRGIGRGVTALSPFGSLPRRARREISCGGTGE
jgi:hypothetical protein